MLKSSSKELIKNCLDTAIYAYVSAVWKHLGTIGTICGLSIEDFKTSSESTLNYNCGTNWTRIYTQVYSSADKMWINGSCVEVANMYSYMSGLYYDEKTNKIQKVNENEVKLIEYSDEYNNFAWRKEKAAIKKFCL